MDGGPITDCDLDEMLGRYNAATGGPWISFVEAGITIPVTALFGRLARTFASKAAPRPTRVLSPTLTETFQH